ncbi:roadblock/LC7 domain-containing protein [Tsukamurella asaccharolytica]|nr:hypothetical protein [Tsukamurella asaccharolytica]
MSGPRRPRNNRQRVEDYYGVHDTGMGSRPAPAAPPAPPTVPPAPLTPPQAPPPGQQPPQAPRRPRVIPPPEVQVAAKEAARAAAGAPPSAPGTPDPEAPRTKPDPLTDPLTSETFQGVQQATDTFDAGVFGYSASTGPQTASSTSSTGFDGGFDTAFDGGFDQFAPPRFEPRAENPVDDLRTDAPQSSHADGETFEATFESHPETDTLDEPDESYIDVEVVDVEVDAPAFAEPLAIDPFPYTQIDETYVDPETLRDLQHRQAPHQPKESGDMTAFNESLNEAMTIDGALGVALVDASSGMALATAGNPAEFNLEVAAAGNSALVQAMGRTLGDLDLEDHIEDILITLGTQYQIVRPINQGTDDLFLYLVLDRSRANLAMARFRLTKLAEQIEL